jgi:prepilin-type N-terminal cleavage/methylation domain-containing protein
MQTPTPRIRRERGFTLVEILVTVAILGAVMVILSTIMMSSNRTHRKTVRQAEIQTDLRQAIDLIAAELRQAGADSASVGILPVVYADSVQVHVRADLNSNGTIQTAEPSEDITYSYNTGSGSIMRNPGTGAVVMLPNVTAMQLRYFNAANQPLALLPLSAADRGLVHSIGLTITAADIDSLPVTLTTRITLRNQ